MKIKEIESSKKKVEEIVKYNLRNNIQNLYDFYTVAKYKNIMHAAIESNISHSTIYRSIKNLEKKYDIKLIIPNNRGIELTPMGLLLYKELCKRFD